jgi:hypothetical protein
MTELIRTIVVASDDHNRKLLAEAVETQQRVSKSGVPRSNHPITLQFSECIIDNIKFILHVDFNNDPGGRNPELLVKYVEYSVNQQAQ